MRQRERILLVEDDKAMRASCRQSLELGGYHVIEAGSPREAQELLLREELHAVVTDLRMPNGGGQKVLQDARNVSPDLPVIVITAYPTVESAVKAFKGGVVDYLLKPFSGDEFLEAVGRALSTSRAWDRAELLRHTSAPLPEMPTMVGRSERFLALLADIRRMAAAEGHVTILGETGSGKELVAKALHRFSKQASGPFVVVNCAAIPDTLIEPELFGFVKGAFTGASEARPGLIEQSDRGILFLDEVGDLSPAAQAKLLRCLEEGACRRVGGVKPRPVRLRVVSATHRDLRARIREGAFREDIYYRLCTLELRVPPLRERPEDIPALATWFLDRLRARQEDSPIMGFAEEGYELLTEHAWPGNVRELQNVIQKAFARATGPLITREELEAGLPVSREQGGSAVALRRRAMKEFERTYLVEALNRHQGNVTRTAQALGIHRTTLQRLMRKLDVSSSS